MLFLPCSLVLFVSLDLIPFASALFKQREREITRTSCILLCRLRMINADLSYVRLCPLHVFLLLSSKLTPSAKTLRQVIPKPHLFLIIALSMSRNIFAIVSSYLPSLSRTAFFCSFTGYVFLCFSCPEVFLPSSLSCVCPPLRELFLSFGQVEPSLCLFLSRSTA